MTEELQTIPECDLGFVELNPSSSSIGTIVLIHGALSSPLEFSLVTPYLTRNNNYHMLIPAIHSNTNNKPNQKRRPFSIPDLCSQLAKLIEKKAKPAGKAHVYGHSMGGHLALNLAMSHPDRVLTLIASGVPLLSRWPWWKQMVIPAVLYTQSILPRLVLSKQRQIQLVEWSVRPASKSFTEELVNTDTHSEVDWTLCKEICAALATTSLLPPLLPPVEGGGGDESINVRCKCLIIAATAKPGDSLDDARTIIKEINAGRSSNGGGSGGNARGIEIKEGSHPWIVQLPELCAQIVQAWIEDKELPSGVENINVMQ